MIWHQFGIFGSPLLADSDQPHGEELKVSPLSSYPREASSSSSWGSSSHSSNVSILKNSARSNDFKVTAKSSQGRF